MGRLMFSFVSWEPRGEERRGQESRGEKKLIVCRLETKWEEILLLQLPVKS